jgi:flavin-dependent dehydrogenase
MQSYDVLVVGGGIAGSVAARLAAEAGLKTLLVEKAKTPREKACSGIQFSYFEKLIGKPIPRDKLCANAIGNMYLITPEGKTIKGKMKILNFWRSTFDRWLNDLAVAAGASVQDETKLMDFASVDHGIRATLQTGTESREVLARYLIGADGMSSRIRKSLHPQDYLPQAPGGSMNYYCRGDGNLDPNGLYMVNIRDYAPIMFAWIYKKDDLWVIGTGAEHDLKEYAERFYEYVCATYQFKGEIVRREGFASPLKGGVYLGEGNILLCGDAAGLLDAYRGVAMDNAALSARFAVQAIREAETTRSPAITAYTRRMAPMKRQLEANEKKRQAKFASDESLAASLTPGALLKDGLKMQAAMFINHFLPPEKVITLPL